MNIVITICLIFLFGILITTITKSLRINRRERLRYFKNFKKGKFALVYIAAIPLYWIGLVFGGTSIGISFLLAIKSSMELVVLKFDYVSIAKLMANNMFYRVTIDICFTLVLLNAIMFTFTLFGQKALNWWRLSKSLHFSKKIYVVVGYNAHNKSIINSIVEDSDAAIILLSGANQEAMDEMFVFKKAHKKYLDEDDLGTVLRDMFGQFNNKIVNVIINTGDSEQCLILTQQVSSLIVEMKLENMATEDNSGLSVYVFGEPENASAFITFTEKTKGCVHFINKYNLIAMDFIEKYPITQFMNGEQIDYTTATIKENIDMNVVMVGFGKTNQQLFLTSVANNQFLTSVQGKLCEKAVNYWIYDKEDSQNDKNLNHSYFRYEHEYLMKKGKKPIKQCLSYLSNFLYR